MPQSRSQFGGEKENNLLRWESESSLPVLFSILLYMKLNFYTHFIYANLIITVSSLTSEAVP
jgi:hypothetical protein